MITHEWMEQEVPLADTVSLPMDNIPCIGRDSELARMRDVDKVLSAYFEKSGKDKAPASREIPSRISSIIGPKGVGKSKILGHLAEMWKPKHRGWNLFSRRNRTCYVADIVTLGRLELDSRHRFWEHIIGQHLDKDRSAEEILLHFIIRNWYRITQVVTGILSRLSIISAIEAAAADDQVVDRLLRELLRKHKGRGYVVLMIDRERGDGIGRESPVFKSIIKHVSSGKYQSERLGSAFHVIVAGRGDTRLLLQRLGLSFSTVMNIELGELSVHAARQIMSRHRKEWKTRTKENLMKSIGTEVIRYLNENVKNMREEVTENAIEYLTQMVDQTVAETNPNKWGDASSVQNSVQLLRRELPNLVAKHVTFSAKSVKKMVEDAIEGEFSGAMQNIEDIRLSEFTRRIVERRRIPFILNIAIFSLLRVVEYRVKAIIMERLVRRLQTRIDEQVRKIVRCQWKDISEVVLDQVWSVRSMRRDPVRTRLPAWRIEGFSLEWMRQVDRHITAYTGIECSSIINDLDRHGCLSVAADIAKALGMAGNHLLWYALEQDLVSPSGLLDHDYIGGPERMVELVSPVNDRITDATQTTISGILIADLSNHLLSEKHVQRHVATINKDAICKRVTAPLSSNNDVWPFIREMLNTLRPNRLIDIVRPSIDSCVRDIGGGHIMQCLDEELEYRLGKTLGEALSLQIDICVATGLWNFVFGEKDYWERVRDAGWDGMRMGHFDAHCVHMGFTENVHALNEGMVEYVRRMQIRRMFSIANVAEIKDRVLNMCLHLWKMENYGIEREHYSDEHICAVVDKAFRDRLIFVSRVAVSGAVETVVRRLRAHIMDLNIRERHRLAVTDVKDMLEVAIKEELNGDVWAYISTVMRGEGMARQWLLENTKNHLENSIKDQTIERTKQRISELQSERPSDGSNISANMTDIKVSRHVKLFVESNERIRPLHPKVKRIRSIMVKCLENIVDACIRNYYEIHKVFDIGLVAALEFDMISVSNCVNNGLIKEEWIKNAISAGMLSAQLTRIIIRSHLAAPVSDIEQNTRAAYILARLEALGCVQYQVSMPEEIVKHTQASSRDAREFYNPHYRILIPELLEWLSAGHESIGMVIGNKELEKLVAGDKLMEAARELIEKLAQSKRSEKSLKEGEIPGEGQ